MEEVVGRDVVSGRSVAVRIANGILERIESTFQETDCWVSAGLVDLQVNGFGGFDINADEVSTDTVVGLARRLQREGVTTFIPTVISATEDKICHVLKVIADARFQDPQVFAAVPYVHVEGPYISPLDGYRGAHDERAVRPPSIAEFERWRAASGGLVGMVTLSPHYAEAFEYIAHAARHGVHVGLGHTHANSGQIRQAVDAGARLSTHLGNGLPLRMPRHENPMWPQLVDDRLTASVIADGHHLPSEVMNAALRCKGRERMLLVSDSVALAGMPAGEYETPVGGRVSLRADGRLCVAGTEMLAGSTASLRQCVAQMSSMTRLSLGEAMSLATVNPGRFVGGRGVFAVGEPADLLRFRWNGEQIEPATVWLGGTKVYERAA